MNTKGCIVEFGKKGTHKVYKGTFFKESLLISKEKEATTVAIVSNSTDENSTKEDTTSIHSIRKSSRKLTQFKSSLDGRNCIICNEIKYEKGRRMSLLSITLKKMGKKIISQNKLGLNLQTFISKMTLSARMSPKKFHFNKILVLYLQLMFLTIKIVINHFVVYVGKDNHKNLNLTKLHTTKKALNFSNWYPTTL